MITNPPHNSNTSFLMKYTGVILDQDLSNIQLQLTGLTFLSDFLISVVTLEAIVVEPILEIEATSLV